MTWQQKPRKPEFNYTKASQRAQECPVALLCPRMLLLCSLFQWHKGISATQDKIYLTDHLYPMMKHLYDDGSGLFHDDSTTVNTEDSQNTSALVNFCEQNVFKLQNVQWCNDPFIPRWCSKNLIKHWKHWNVKNFGNARMLHYKWIEKGIYMAC